MFISKTKQNTPGWNGWFWQTVKFVGDCLFSARSLRHGLPTIWFADNKTIIINALGRWDKRIIKITYFIFANGTHCNPFRATGHSGLSFDSSISLLSLNSCWLAHAFLHFTSNSAFYWQCHFWIESWQRHFFYSTHSINYLLCLLCFCHFWIRTLYSFRFRFRITVQLCWLCYIYYSYKNINLIWQNVCNLAKQILNCEMTWEKIRKKSYE